MRARGPGRALPVRGRNRRLARPALSASAGGRPTEKVHAEKATASRPAAEAAGPAVGIHRAGLHGLDATGSLLSCIPDAVCTHVLRRRTSAEIIESHLITRPQSSKRTCGVPWTVRSERGIRSRAGRPIEVALELARGRTSDGRHRARRATRLPLFGGSLDKPKCGRTLARGLLAPGLDEPCDANFRGVGATEGRA